MRSSFTVHRLLFRSVMAASSLFAWVLVLELKLQTALTLQDALVETALLYALSQIVLVLALPFIAQGYRDGMIRFMALGGIALAASLIALGGTLLGSVDPALGLVFFAVNMGLYRALYATPFAMIQYDAGRDSYAHEFLYAIIPLGAALLYQAGAAYQVFTLYVLAAFAILAMLLLTRFEAFEEYSWSYRESFGMLLEPVHARYSREHLIKGYEGAALFFLWPLFVFIILDFSFIGLGAIYTASLLGFLALREVMPKHDEGTPALAALIAGGVWLGRSIAAGPVAVTLLQLAGSAGAPFRMRAHQLDDYLADNGTFLDEVTVLKELALGLGRAVFAMVFVATAWLLPPFWALGLTFVTAAIAAAYATYHSIATR